MEFLLDFLEKEPSDSKIYNLLKCDINDAKILQKLCQIYINGSASIVVYELLCDVFGKKNYEYLKYLKNIKSLLNQDWISQSYSPLNQDLKEETLSLLHCEISLSNSFLKILEAGEIASNFPPKKAYEDELDYLKDQFSKIELYKRLSMIDHKTQAGKRLAKQIEEFEEAIKARLNFKKTNFQIEQIFKENSLDKKEQIIFLTLLKEEYSGDFDNFRDLNSLIKLISFNEVERIKNRSLLEEGGNLIESGLIEYEENFNVFGSINKNFFINEEILQQILRPKSQNKKLKLENLIKEQEIFELLESPNNMEDVVLNEQIKQVLNDILKQTDKKIINKLNSWGIKAKKSIDAKLIFYGAPGTGKTMSALALAKSLKKQVLNFDCSKILSKYVGESEQNVRKIFETYKEICNKTKSEPLLLLNEADQFLSTRLVASNTTDKMHNQMQNIFLEQIEKFDGLLIATTNFIESFDNAFSRRFDHKIEFKKPDFEERLNIWKKILPKNADFDDNFNLKRLAKFELSGAQIVLVLKNTAIKVAIKEKSIFTNEDFEFAIKRELNNSFDMDKKMGFR